MKRDFVTATVIAFALLWMSISPALSKQSERTRPSLAETEQFINRHGVTSSMSEHFPNDKSKGRSIIYFRRFEVRNCKAEVTSYHVVNDYDKGTKKKTEPLSSAEIADRLSYTKLGRYQMPDEYQRITPEYW